MTTSLSKSTIPPYNPNDSYMSPRVEPRVKFEGRENFEKNRGSLNIGDWAVQGKNWESPRPNLKLKFDDAFKAYKRNTEGSMKELMGGYCENPAIPRTGPRISKSAWENYRKNRGSFHNIIGSGYGSNDPSVTAPPPRVFREGTTNEEKNRRGEVGNLLGHYGRMPLSARPVPRVKFDGGDILANHQRGSNVEKTLKMVPPTSRPSSTQFFNHKYY